MHCRGERYKMLSEYTSTGILDLRLFVRRLLVAGTSVSLLALWSSDKASHAARQEASGMAKTFIDFVNLL